MIWLLLRCLGSQRLVNSGLPEHALLKLVETTQRSLPSAMMIPSAVIPMAASAPQQELACMV